MVADQEASLERGPSGIMGPLPMGWRQTIGVVDEREWFTRLECGWTDGGRGVVGRSIPRQFLVVPRIARGGQRALSLVGWLVVLVCWAAGGVRPGWLGRTTFAQLMGVFLWNEHYSAYKYNADAIKDVPNSTPSRDFVPGVVINS